MIAEAAADRVRRKIARLHALNDAPHVRWIRELAERCRQLGEKVPARQERR